MNQNKVKLNKAFAQLRKAGYFAKQSFWCCQNCAWTAIPEDKSKKVVFYHKQDTDQLKESGECFLAFAGDPNEIKTILESNGVEVEHDGNSNTRIKIKL